MNEVKHICQDYAETVDCPGCIAEEKEDIHQTLGMCVDEREHLRALAAANKEKTVKDIKRYILDDTNDDPCMTQHPDGAYVLFNDVEALQKNGWTEIDAVSNVITRSAENFHAAIWPMPHDNYWILLTHDFGREKTTLLHLDSLEKAQKAGNAFLGL